MEPGISHYLTQISPDAVCGGDLEYDPLFAQMVQAAQGEPERQIGDHITPAVAPDWKTVRAIALQLLERSHDIRIAVLLARALANTEQFQGVEQGLELVHGLLEHYWESVYPQADAEDDYPVLRMNVIGGLGDYPGFLNALSHIPLTNSLRLGAFSMRDIDIAEGKIKPLKTDSSPPALSVIKGAFKDSATEILKEKAESIDRSLEWVNKIIALTIEKVGSKNGPDLLELVKLLTQLGHTMRKYSDAGNQSERTDYATGEVPMLSTETEQGSPAIADSSGINSRADVARAIDSICHYFNTQEPSSPVPFLLKRAKRLLSMDFMEIVNDMAPEGLGQVENICSTEKNPGN
ncbi:Uncharacterized protein ImpA [hydrothermal vent metagenome]|uniref:Uncharacterized protein ImpA n=1 Tax=hydrothermal vent metagenome TaxID=652676 RepID=A0A3B0YIR2_9ZZZZ